MKKKEEEEEEQRRSRVVPSRGREVRGNSHSRRVSLPRRDFILLTGDICSEEFSRRESEQLPGVPYLFVLRSRKRKARNEGKCEGKRPAEFPQDLQNLDFNSLRTSWVLNIKRGTLKIQNAPGIHSSPFFLIWGVFSAREAREKCWKIAAVQVRTAYC